MDGWVAFANGRMADRGPEGDEELEAEQTF